MLMLSFFIFFSSCSQKSQESVFPNQAMESCRSLTIPKQYLVAWEDGRYTLEKAESDDELRQNFIKNNLPQIRHIDRDIRIQTEVKSSALAQNSNYSSSWAVDRVSARSLWNLGYQGQGITVGVVDGFVDKSHVQLASQIIYAQQFNNEINNVSVNRHGTHVAGIIVADGTKGPAQGIAPLAKIASGQFMSNDGAGSIGTGIVAMQAVARAGAKIINLSWGGAPCIQNLKNAMEDLSAKGILIVTAAGNESVDLDYQPNFPAAFMVLNQINVAATGLDDLLTYFSNRGNTTVNVAAPGQSILSTVPGNGVEMMDGTSMAAPVVAGSAALLMSAYPNAPAHTIRDALLRSVDIPNWRLQTQTGGRINVLKAYNSLKQTLQ